MSKAKQVVELSVRLIVPAGQASPSPPVGPALGARGVKSMDFCKEFNARTSHLIPGVPLPVLVTIRPDKSFTFDVRSPTTTYFLKQVLGVKKGSRLAGRESIGEVSVKYVYEIARIKQKDASLRGLPLESICRSIVGAAKSVGVRIVN